MQPSYNLSKPQKISAISEPPYPTMSKSLWLKALEKLRVSEDSEVLVPGKVLSVYKKLKVKDSVTTYLQNKYGITDNDILVYKEKGTTGDEYKDEVLQEKLNIKPIKDAVTSQELTKRLLSYGLEPAGKSMREMELMLGMAIFAQEHPGEEFPDQFDPMLAKDATTDDGEWVDSVFKSEEWLIQEKKNGMRSILQLVPGKPIKATSRAVSVKNYIFPSHAQNVLDFVGLVNPFDSKVVLDGELCLWSKSRVMTDHGLFTIGELLKKDTREYKVYTGFKWANFIVRDMGESEAQEVVMANGVSFVCSLDHKMYVYNSRFPLRKTFSEVGGGKRAFMPMEVAAEFRRKEHYLTFRASEELYRGWTYGKLDLTKFQEVEFVYWMGRTLGDGTTSALRVSEGDRQSYNVDLSFSRKEIEDLCRYLEFLKNLGIHKEIPKIVRGCYTVKLANKTYWELFKHYGYHVDGRATNKRVPDFIWEATMELRVAFLEGLFDADAHHIRNSLRLASEELVKEVQLLKLSVGEYYSSCGPFIKKGTDFTTWAVQKTKYGRPKSGVLVRRKREIGVEHLYTLTVLDEDHSYWADGFIHKNCSPKSKIWTGSTWTTSPLQACVALVAMEPTNSLEIQRTIGSLKYEAFDILFYNGENLQDKPYEERDQILEEAIAALVKANPGVSISKVETIRDYDSAWKIFQDYISSGKEGVMMKKKSGTYRQGYRSGDLLKLKGYVTVDGFISGSVPSTKGKGNENLIGGFQISAFVDGKPQVIANISNITAKIREEATTLVDGEPQLNPEFLDKCVEIKGQEFSKNSRLGSARIIEWREDKNPEDCQLTSEDVKPKEW